MKRALAFVVVFLIGIVVGFGMASVGTELNTTFTSVSTQLR